MGIRFLLILLFSACIINGISQNWVWARSAQSTGFNWHEGSSVVTDGSGSVYAVGAFQAKTISFGSITLANYDTSGNTYNAFIAKYDASGNIIWARILGGPGGGFLGCMGEHVAVDGNGNVYITGSFDSPTFVAGTFTLTNLSPDTSEAFLVKLSSSGNVVWTRSAKGSDFDFGYGVATDAAGNIYITGRYFSPAIIFGTDTLFNPNSFNGDDMFLTKYTSSGSVAWARRLGGSGGDMGQSVATDNFGNVYLSGVFTSPYVSAGTYTVNNIGGNWNVLLAKWDGSGNSLWLRNAGGTLSPLFAQSSVMIDNASNIYLTGAFSTATINFGGHILNNTVSNKNDVYMVKYQPSGTVLWAKSWGGSGDDVSYCIASDLTGNIYLSVGFDSPNIPLGNDTIYYPPGFNNADPMFVLKCDSSGNPICHATLPSGGDDKNGITVNSSGDIYLCNDFQVNPFIVGNDTLIRTGAENAFVAKLQCNLTGIKEIFDASKIRVFPNPSNGNMELDCGKTGIEGIVIKDLTGREVTNIDRRALGLEGKIHLDLRVLENGVYIIFIKSGIDVAIKKLISFS